MSPRSASPPDGTALVDDFEWPPRADDVSVHPIEANPWHTMDDDADDTANVISEPDALAAAAPPPPRRRRL